MKKYSIALVALLAMPFSVWSADRSTDPDRFYLLQDEVVNSCELLPPPPEAGSARFAYDMEQYNWGKSVRDTERGEQAVRDAYLGEGWIDQAFSEAFGYKITKETTPEIYKLITHMKDDVGHLAPRCAKDKYMRPRPFMVFCEPSGTPNDEAALRKNGSYPSGHTSIGWATALVLAEINPARQQEIIERGYEFGQSRVIVGVHYQSDVDNGRIVGSAAVAALHANDDFNSQLAKAKKEFIALSREIKN
jgi:acid phosphatase (class A)